MDSTYATRERAIRRDDLALDEVCREAMAGARKLGATDAVVKMSDVDELAVTVRNEHAEVIRTHHRCDLTVMVWNGGRRGVANTTDLSPRAVRSALDAAWHIARFTADDPSAAPADIESTSDALPDLDLYHPGDLSVDRAADLARVAQAGALSLAPGLVRSDGATLRTQQGRTLFSSSRGFTGAYDTSMHQLYCAVVAGSGAGMQRGDWGLSQRQLPDGHRSKALGIYATQRALARLDSRRPPTGTWPILFEAPVALSLLDALCAATRGTAIYMRQTCLPDSLGSAIMASHLDVFETPTERGGLASMPFDAEGVRPSDRSVVDSGTLQAYFLSSYAARRLGMRSTGHAGGPYNLTLSSALTNERDDLDGMLKRMGKGVLVTELLGQGVNIVTGDYSRGASGFWVEHGEIQFAIDEFTIAGNLKAMWRDIIAVGTDVFQDGPYRSGSMLIEKMRVAGV